MSIPSSQMPLHINVSTMTDVASDDPPEYEDSNAQSYTFLQLAMRYLHVSRSFPALLL